MDMEAGVYPERSDRDKPLQASARFRKIFLGVTFILAIFLSPQARAEPLSYLPLGNIPVLHEGRLKPLDTFARVNLLPLYGKSSLKDLRALDWLGEVLFDQESAYQREIFDIKNPEVLAALELPRRESKKYSFLEVKNALAKIQDTLTSIHRKSEEERTPAQNQLAQLYFKVLNYYDLSNSFSLITPQFKIHSTKLAAELGLEAEKDYNYMEMLRVDQLLQKKMEAIKAKKGAAVSDEEKEVTHLSFQMFQIRQGGQSEIFRIFPPQWQGHAEEWFSPWALVLQGQGSPESAKYLGFWKDLAYAVKQQDATKIKQASAAISQYTLNFPEGVFSASILNLEVRYNHLDLFTKSLSFYILAFLLLTLSWIAWEKKARFLAFMVLLLGGALHLAGVVLRIIIMARPPVSNLYESIVFVGLIASVFGIILESKRKNGLGILIATVVGATLHFLGNAYASDGDTMGMLVAVLNTNFWLATHVVTISIGYGCSFVGGVVGHVYLIRRLLPSTKESRLEELYQAMMGIALFALFFSLFGTILGGIWADQSWGRFWGWDPKENGALLIVLWLIWLLHGRISGQIKALGFALGMVIINIIVALAWFGVNLLNVGLHSYGFTQNIATNLALFCVGELLFGLVFYFLNKRRRVKPWRNGL
ncbi:MAG: cytochrome c biogenesis protein CcsA [Deltaproteobacteria bacterium]|nr:cytochrome c biogenesis protein CcsA [Deltaproteobacteria bacterium]